jgi:hypothetical protein
MVLCDVGLVETHSVHLVTELISTQDRRKVCTECTLGLKIVLVAPNGNSYVTWVKWKLISVHLEIVLILTHNRCTVCVERRTSSEIILGATDCTPR